MTETIRVFPSPAARSSRPERRPARALILTIALLALLAAALPALAGPTSPEPPLGESETPDGATAKRLDTIVVVASRAPEPLSQVVASVTAIDRETLERELVQDSADLIRYTPGVAMIADGNRFGRQGFSIRGLEGNRVRVEIDGVPMPDAFAVGQFAAAGRDLVDLEIVEQVEILRGPASTLYGSDALAGVVALRSRDPAEILAGAEGDHYFGGRLGYNSRDRSRLASVLWAGDVAPGWQALAAVSRRDGHEDDNRPIRPEDAANPADYRRDSVFGKLLFDAGAGGRHGFTVEHSREDRFTDVRSLRFGPGRFNTTFRLEGDDGYRRDRVGSRSVWAAPLTWLDALDLSVHGQRAASRQDSAQWRLPDRASRNETLRLRRFEFEQRVAGVDLLAQSRFDWLGARHWTVYGLDVELSRFSGFRDGSQTDLATGAITRTVLGENLPVRDFPNSRERGIGLFWQDEIAIGQRLALIPGLRWEHYRLNPKPDPLFREDFPDLPVVSVVERRLTPRFSARWSPGDGHTLFAQYAEGFRAPPFSDANIALSLTGVNIELRPNPALRPETSRGLELGWRFTGERLRASLSGYENRYRDLIDTRANLGPDPVTGALVFQSVNRDRARIRGIETELDWLLGERWSLRAATAWARGDDSRRGLPLNGIQPARAIVGLRYQAHRWGLEGMLTAVAGKDRVDASAGPLFRPPGHALIDLLAWVEPWRRVRVNLGLFNLADRRVWDWSSARGIDPNADNLDFFTRPGRSLAATATFGW